MKKNSYKILGIIYISVGVLTIADFTGFINSIFSDYADLMLIISGLLIAFISFSSGSRITIFIAAVLFIYGIKNFVEAEYEILNGYSLAIPTMIFASATGFFLLFLENTKAKALLFGSVCLYISFYLFIDNYKTLESFHVMTALSNEIINLWPLLFILVGVSILTQNRAELTDSKIPD
ncbi:MAG: hypothetical protein K9J12_04415 [Melioribacteraceae bacterium]|nr:hypothetical protein [Melioribacteraceae bacterium]MCF8263566.1 hypothetical protein [Melioribacteraceae bacterium]MCF8431239.1 hypothetical protein [Melioribacteraceae bacterium]